MRYSSGLRVGQQKVDRFNARTLTKLGQNEVQCFLTFIANDETYFYEAVHFLVLLSIPLIHYLTYFLRSPEIKGLFLV